MLLRECVSDSGLTWRAFAAAVKCSHNHLHQAAALKKSLSLPLSRRIKALHPSFDIEGQAAAFDAAEHQREHGAGAHRSAA